VGDWADGAQRSGEEGERAVQALIAVLAGGRATRLGGAKATAELGGRPLIEHVLDAAGPDAVVVAKPGTALPPLAVPVLEEPAEPSHPMAGIVEALRDSGGLPVLAVACDMPFVTHDLLAWLAELPEPLAVPALEGRLHPLLGRYPPELLGELEAALAARRPLRETVAGLGPYEIPASELEPFGDPGRLLFNVNTPEDLQAAERLLAEGPG